MIKIDDYLIVQEQNKLTIILPQTIESIQDTTTPIATRKHKLSKEELAVIVEFVKQMYEIEN